ncbi:50S ribosomal protein L33 ['Cynodon dactylon' phytoplasma]|nr:50S ribosomal protein L33 ['Cynodon dactylon' phytoplasma]KAB8122003.1 50S ribosomal protein L33 ['Cynodon dactylon' phytoplasma]
MKKKNILVCSNCLNRNYKIFVHNKDKRLNLKKYCSTCKKHFSHEETR